MRLVAIRGQNLASLGGEFALELDQDPLASAGLFAITGPTGAGKSTLLDALCVALFDATPRHADGNRVLFGRAEEQEQWIAATDVRSLLRRGTGVGYAEVDFTGRDGRLYRARWSVRRARQRPEGRLQAQSLELRDLASDQLIGGGTKSETLLAIEGKLGLSFEQFRRSALLAQGDFARFLRANERERSELLERMTGTEIYGRISAAAFRRAADEKAELEALRAAVSQFAILSDDEREALEVSAGQLIAVLETSRAELERAKAAVAWHARGAELAVAEEAAAADCEDANRDWTELEEVRRLLVEVERARELRAPMERVAHARAACGRHREQRERLDVQLGDMRGRATEIGARAAAASAVREQAQRHRGQAAGELDRAAELDRALAAAAREHEEAQAAAAEAQARLALVQSAEQRAAVRLADYECGGVGALRDLDEEPVLVELRARYRNHRQQHDELEQGRKALVDAEDEARDRLKLCTESLNRAAHEHQLAKVVMARAEDESRTQSIDVAAAAQAAAQEQREVLRELAGTAERARNAAQGAQQAQDKALAARERGRAASSEAEKLATYSVGARARAQEAEQALERLTLSLELAHHRAQLRAGHECPLCGGLEHPWAEDAPEVSALVAEQRSAVESAREALTVLERERAGSLAHASASEAEAQAHEVDARAAAAQLEEGRRDWRTRLRELGELPLLEDPVAQESAEWLARRRAAVERRLGEANDAFAVAKRLHTALTEASGRASAKAADLEQARDALRAAERAAEDAAAQLIAADQRRERLRDELASLSERVRETLSSQLAMARERLLERVAERDGRQAVCAQRARQAEELRDARSQMFGGRSTADVRRELDDAVANAEQAEREAATQREQIAQEVTRLEAQLQACEAELELASQEKAAADQLASETLMRLALNEAAAVELLAYSPQWVAERQRAVDAAKERRAHAASIREERAAQRRMHLQDAPPVLDAAAAGEAARVSGAAADAAQRQVTELELRRRSDDDSRAKRADMTARIADRQRRAEAYQSLSELIGSADGKKFRTFAQSLTLDALLGYANEHLAELVGRYRLVRVPGSDLELQVVDRAMGDEVRAVTSLSGGESFLVSLALALALSSLAARDTRVESLLIDEGFGTLDPATLEVALSVLDSLQASGRKVGLISHVPGLAERVGVRVVVAPQGAGRSVVQVDA